MTPNTTLDITGTPYPLLSASPTSLDFHDAEVGTVETVEVENVGSGTLTLSGATLSGTDATRFDVVQPSSPFDLGFTFRFFGQDVSQYWISSNGWITFADPGSNAESSNTMIPDADAPNALVAWFWDDLNPTETSVTGRHLYTQTTTVNGTDAHVLTFERHPEYSADADGWITDRAVPFAAEALTYRLRQVDADGSATYGPEVRVRLDDPDRLALRGNSPNPFARRTTLRYTLPRAADVHLSVYDALGRRVATLAEGRQPAGRKERVFDAGRLPSGLYLVRLQADDRVVTRRVTVVR